MHCLRCNAKSYSLRRLTDKFSIYRCALFIRIPIKVSNHHCKLFATANAISKSSSKSAPSSKPTLNLNNPGGLTLPPSGSILRQCSIKLSVPPKLVPRLNTRTAPATAMAVDSSKTSKLSIPPPQVICFLAIAYWGWESNPR